MPRDEDNKIFDVTRPSRVSPPSTSRPIIVSQRSQDDPMVVGDTSKSEAPSHEHSDVPPVKKPISVFDANSASPVHTVAPANIDTPGLAAEAPLQVKPELHEPVHQQSDASLSDHQPPIKPLDASNNHGPAGPYQPHFTSVNSLISGTEDKEGDAEHGGYGGPATIEPEHTPFTSENEHAHDGPGVVGDAPFSTPTGAGPKGSMFKMFLMVLGIILIFIIGAYLAVDGGLVKSDVKLPFHILNKQKPSTPVAVVKPVTTNTTPTTVAVTAPPLPTGFTNFKLAEASLAFGYPSTWGTPKVTPDLGYTKRGGTIRSDGSHAYVITFATNKDVELALTSGKYLPPVRGTQYYDFIQWCTGTNDAKTYKQTLHFTTTAGNDIPSTIVCDQGPFEATKISTDVIEQLKFTAEGTSVASNLYTKNLPKNPTIAVLRVKDAAMTNDTLIKQLLDTTQDLAAPSTSVTSGTSSTSTSP